MSEPSLPRLTEALQGLYQRAMLGSKELSRLRALAEARVPQERLLSWLDEAATQRNARGERVSMSHALSIVETRAQQWAQQHLGERYERELVGAKEGSAEREALTRLIALVELSAKERSATQSASLFEWLGAQLHALMGALERSPHLDLSAQLSTLDEALYARALALAPRALVERVEAEALKALKRERGLARPQDFSRALKAVMWAQLRAELHLPPLHLKLYGGW